MSIDRAAIAFVVRRLARDIRSMYDARNLSR